MCKSLVLRLLDWFEGNARDLPWRHDRTPYRVWLAEVMLQQTQVDTVIPYYERFLTRFPEIETLAEASLEDVLRTWEGLGYYARARNLHACARIVVNDLDGKFPSDAAALRALPGIGPYIAGALASIAFGENVPAVDGNVRRVLCRVFRVEGDPASANVQHHLDDLARGLLPLGQAGRFNEAMMELGATVCMPRAPRCTECPWSEACAALESGTPELLPMRPQRRRVPHYDVAAAVTLDGTGRVLVAQRHQNDMLGGLWEFPGGKREEGETLPECLRREMKEELDIIVEIDELLAVVDHAYTHFRITLYAFLCHVEFGVPQCLDCAAFRWVQTDELDRLPMSRVDRLVAQGLQGDAGPQAGASGRIIARKSSICSTCSGLGRTKGRLL
ncbi:MAG: A/G-specific adenine glycosylase [Chloroflexi bacterium]|nr:A/G-specific adenine glycosylase [Chloroflexota bacterium]